MRRGGHSPAFDDSYDDAGRRITDLMKRADY
jgi:hypothetical protein